MKFDWNRARAFLVTAEEGSLSAAARGLGLSQPTLGRQVEALEAALGVTLFDRTGRGLALTRAGLELLEHARGMGEAAFAFSRAATGQADAIAGSVTVSASEAVAAFRLPPIVARLRREEPGIEIEVVASNAASDLRRREADIAIRNFRPTQTDLVARKLGDVPGYLYAAPSYLERLGHPERPEDLNGAEFIGFDHTEAMVNALNALGLSLTARNFAVLSQNHLVGWQMVRAGVGIGVMTDDIARDQPGVVRVLPTLPPIMVPLWLTAHRELATSRRIRRVWDALAEGLAP